MIKQQPARYYLHKNALGQLVLLRTGKKNKHIMQGTDTYAIIDGKIEGVARLKSRTMGDIVVWKVQDKDGNIHMLSMEDDILFTIGLVIDQGKYNIGDQVQWTDIKYSDGNKVKLNQ